MLKILESDFVFRGTLEEVLEAYLNWVGPEPHDTYVWGGNDFPTLIQNIEQFCQESFLPKFSGQLERFINLESAYRDSSGDRTFRLKQMIESKEMEFYGTPHKALDDSTNTARLLLCIDEELQGFLKKNYLNSNFLQDEKWKEPVIFPNNPTFKEYAAKVIGRKLELGLIPPESRNVMERFVLTAPFSDHRLKYLKAEEVGQFLESMTLYIPAKPHISMFNKMISDVITKAHFEGLIGFIENDIHRKSFAKTKKKVKERPKKKKLWNVSQKLFDEEWSSYSDKAICEIAFFTGMNFESIVKMRGQDIKDELEKIYHYPWSDGIKTQSESLTNFLADKVNKEWIFSFDGINFPFQQSVEATLRNECKKLICCDLCQ